MEAVVERENLKKALARVKRNKGAAGIDGMSVDRSAGLSERPLARDPGPAARRQLQAAAGAAGRDPEGDGRHAAARHSDGARPLHPAGGDAGAAGGLGRDVLRGKLRLPAGALGASGGGTGAGVHRVGHAVVVDFDLEKFFDRVNHDILMGLVAKRVADKRLLKLIRGFLNAGVLEGGLVSPTEEGTPQGGPLSPLLSNLMLDVLDKELEKRGHRFVRYADDCNIYVRSRHAGERVMAGIEKFLAKRLKLKVNKAKSAVAKPSARKFLGFSFTGGSQPRRRIAPQALARFKPGSGS